MPRKLVSWLGCVLICMAALLIAPLALGQVASPAETPQTVADVLHRMSDRAGVIFLGEVISVVRPAGVTGVVEINFRVDQAIRGCSAGSYTLREWSGLWAVNFERYRAGQRLLMLLHTPGAAGLSSPVDGLDGAIPIRQGGTATPYQATSAPAQIVDLRWLATKLPHIISYRSGGSALAKPAIPPVPFLAEQPSLVRARSGSANTVFAIAPLSASAADSSVPAQQASVTAVVDMLTSWEKARHVAQ